MVKLLGCDHANFPNFPDHPPSIEQGSPELRPELQLPRWIDPEPTAKLGIALALLDTAILGQGSSVQCQRFIASAKLLQAFPISISLGTIYTESTPCGCVVLSTPFSCDFLCLRLIELASIFSLVRSLLTGLLLSRCAPR